MQRQLDDEVVDPPVELLDEAAGDAGQHAVARDVEHGLESEERSGQDRECDKGRHAASGQHAVVDLQHEERAREIEHVQQCREYRHTHQGGSARRQRSRKLRCTTQVAPNGDPAGWRQQALQPSDVATPFLYLFLAA